MEADGDDVQSQRHGVQAHHIKKRALKNKALSISLDGKGLRDFVTGFHKRKKKRRKEAQNQQQEALRRKRIELRKKRKLDREYALYGGAPPDPEGESNKNDEVEDDEQDNNNDEEEENPTSVSGTKVYDTGNGKVMVTTSEISREDDFVEVPRLTLGSEKKPNLPGTKPKK
ncbi:putative nucleolar protein [Helianthus anomalus]